MDEFAEIIEKAQKDSKKKFLTFTKGIYTDLNKVKKGKNIAIGGSITETTHAKTL